MVPLWNWSPCRKLQYRQKYKIQFWIKFRINGNNILSNNAILYVLKKEFLKKMYETYYRILLHFQRGEILITYSTDIGWSPYFPILGGIVTEIGGLVSHGTKLVIFIILCYVTYVIFVLELHFLTAVILYLFLLLYFSVTKKITNCWQLLNNVNSTCIICIHTIMEFM